MSSGSGDLDSNLRSTLHQICMNEVVIKGQCDVEALLERLTTCVEKATDKKNEENFEKGEREDLKWLEEYKLKESCFESKEDEEEWSVDLQKLTANNHFRIRKKTQKRICHTQNGGISKENTVNGGLVNCDCCAKMPHLEGMTIYEELIRDLQVIASASDEIFENEFEAETKALENEIEKQLKNARKNFRDDVMINIGYRFLVLNMKKKIMDIEKEIEKEKRRELKLTKWLKSKRDFSIKNISYDDDNEDDAVFEKDTEEGKEIARMKESILLADCLLVMQKRELKVGKQLTAFLSSQVEIKKEILGVIEKDMSIDTESPFRMKSTDFICEGTTSVNGSLQTNDWSYEYMNLWNEGESKLESMLASDSLQSSDESRNAFSDTKDNNYDTEDTSYYSRDGPSIERVCGIQNTLKYSHQGLHDYNCVDYRNLPKNERNLKNDKIMEMEAARISQDSNNNVSIHLDDLSNYLGNFHDITEIISKCYEDNLCDIWLERRSASSNLIRIPYEAHEDETEHVIYHVNDAPRALGRSKRGKGRIWFRQTIYRSKAIAV